MRFALYRFFPSSSFRLLLLLFFFSLNSDGLLAVCLSNSFVSKRTNECNSLLSGCARLCAAASRGFSAGTLSFCLFPAAAFSLLHVGIIDVLGSLLDYDMPVQFISSYVRCRSSEKGSTLTFFFSNLQNAAEAKRQSNQILYTKMRERQREREGTHTVNERGKRKRR